MQVTHDEEANAVYVHLKELPYAYGKSLDAERHVDFSQDGTPIGVEFLAVSHDISLDGIPEREAVERALAPYSFKIFA